MLHVPFYRSNNIVSLALSDRSLALTHNHMDILRNYISVAKISSYYEFQRDLTQLLKFGIEVDRNDVPLCLH